MSAATLFSTPFTRNRMLAQLHETARWDLVVIGGGATGLGVAVDAANRGLKTLLLEQSDFAKGTSSRSTKLVHGGVRYLAQGNIKLVFEALRERGYLLRNATHLVKKQSFVIPCFSRFSLAKYWTGLKLYDWLSGTFSFGASRFLSRQEVVQTLPGVQTRNLVGGIRYFDGRFDDARLALNLAQTAAEQGATVLNYMQVTALKKQSGKVSGLFATDLLTGRQYDLNATVVVNATGVFVDHVLQYDKPEAQPTVRPSQGIHLVLNRSFLPGNAALMIPQTSDGRVLFALPWYQHLLVGTTDTPVAQHTLEPKALDEEVDFVLANLKQYLTGAPSRKDVLSVFAGLRPLAAPAQDGSATKEISRNHKLIVSASGLVTITGGKWTTYRKMAEDAVNAVEKVGLFGAKPCGTKSLSIHSNTSFQATGHFAIYGADAAAIQQLAIDDPALSKPLIEGYPYTAAEVVWAVRNEFACTLEDVLARRLRLLFLDARAALQAAPGVARMMAAEKGLDAAWIKSQVTAFEQVAIHYLLAEKLHADGVAPATDATNELLY